MISRFAPGGYYWQPPSSWVATAIGGSALVGAATNIFTSSRASDAQADAAQRAAEASRQMYMQTRQDFAPYREAGYDALSKLNQRLEFLTSPIVMDQETLEKTPGYQFTRTQGLKAVQNSATARGLGISGAALKGAATFTTGLADQTYKTQFDIENTNRTNAYNRLKALVDTGAGAAKELGTVGQKSADTTASGEMAVGNAQAAGWNAAGGAVTRAADSIGGYMAYRGLYGARPGAPVYTGGPQPASGAGEY